MKGGDSSGISETAETPQERSDEEAWPRPRKASTRSGMCSSTIGFFIKTEYLPGMIYPWILSNKVYIESFRILKEPSEKQFFRRRLTNTV